MKKLMLLFDFNNCIKKVFLLLWTTILSCSVGFSQQKYYDFNTAVPANFSSSTGSLTLGTEHVKDGENALKWTVANGTVLTANNLGISSADVSSWTASSADFYIYSLHETNDTLIFKFYDKKGVKQREGHMLLNYKGWREYQRSYRFDYNNGKELPGFDLDKMEIVYKPENPATKAIIYLDAFKMVGDAKVPLLMPCLKLDKQHFSRSADIYTMFNDFSNTPDPVKPATDEELRDAQKIKALYQHNVPTVSAADLAAAKKYVDDCQIRRNPDQSITGKGITDLDTDERFGEVATVCGSLASAAIHNGDTEAKNKLILFTEYLIDQGLAEGGRLFIHLGHYGYSRKFPDGFLKAVSLYPDTLRDQVIRMLKWHIGYNRIYGAKSVPNIDFLTLRSGFMFELAALASSPDALVRDLKDISRYLSLYTEITQGSSDWMKVDGCVFHHNAHYIGYCYAMPTYVQRVYSLKGTVFRITQRAFQNMALAYKSQFLQTSKGMLYANASSGRHPFTLFTFTPKSLEQLVEVGGDIEGKAYDPELASLCNYVLDSHKFSVPKADWDGYYQFNYAQLGIARKNNWVAAMRGFTDKSWGVEIYAKDNRYGRYQSYGSLEIMYNGDTTATGIVEGGKGWDWNVTPGATTVHLPWEALQAAVVRADEYQKNSFAGALSLGKSGVFAMDFMEDAKNNYKPNHLQFHKTVFSFDNILVCLGSGISSTNGSDTTATNLFQTITNKDNPAIHVNSSKSIFDDNYKQMLSAKDNDVWMVNGQTTGFYIPKGNGQIIIERGQQTTPIATTLTGKQTATANFSKAYISHGVSPNQAKYQFVVVPATTPKNMAAYAKQFSKGEIYSVLSQTNALHAVKYIPGNITEYAFFEANNNVNIGLVKSITGKALVGVTENEKTITVTINNPDLNTVPDDKSKWRSGSYNVSLQLNGNWKVVENASNAQIKSDNNTLTATFTLKDGLLTTLNLEKN